MKLNLRNGIRIFFFFLIFILWFTGRIGMWGPLLLLGLLATPIWGRIYCGWVCPIATSIDILKPFLPKPPLAKRKDLLLDKKVRTIIFLISFLLLITFNKIGFVIPFFIFLIPVGIIFTLLFGEACWHRNCFFGTVYSWFAGISRKGYTFNDQNCSRCGLCKRICPNECIIENTEQELQIEKKHCLVCGKCREACQTDNIEYRTLK